MTRNRFRISMTALAVTGSLAFGVAPATADDLKEFVHQGVTYYQNPTTGEWFNNTERALQTDAQANDLEKPDSNAVAEQVKAISNLKTYVYEGTTYYLNPHTGYWFNNTERALQEDAEANDLEKPADTAIKKALAESDSTDPDQGSDKLDTKTILGIALPATLIIGGIVWYLMKDGKTYTQDQARVNQEPTNDEKAASNEMLANNAEEVKKQSQAAPQGGAPAAGQTASRGMLAETGSNNAVRGLFLLTLLSVIGATAFFTRRRFAA